jgi:hypothetical protein
LIWLRQYHHDELQIVLTVDRSYFTPSKHNADALYVSSWWRCRDSHPGLIQVLSTYQHPYTYLNIIVDFCQL